MKQTDFTGFPRELPDFLLWLRFNNTIEKQAENITKYKEIVTAPLTGLYEALLPAAAEISSRLDTGRARCVSSPYTDRRFSSNVPLKEYMYIRFKLNSSKSDIPGLYIDMGAEYYSYGMRIYNQTSQGTDKLRRVISAETELFGEALDKALSQGFKIIGDSYKTDKYNTLPPSSAKTLLNHKNYYIAKTTEINERIYSPALVQEITEGFFAVSGLLNLIINNK